MVEYHNLDDEKRIPYLVKLAEAKGFPILNITEDTIKDFDRGEDDYIPDYSGRYVFDTATLMLRNSSDPIWDLLQVNYVGDLIERALLGEKSCETSRKYSFGDTPTWWLEFVPSTVENRTIIDFEIEVYS